MTSGPQRLHRVFVVDDDEMIVSSLTSILTYSNFDTSAFTVPLVALEAVRFERPDLLISDVMMPLLSGIDLAIQVRRICPECHILLFSGVASTMDLLESARANGYDFELLSKPVHPAILLATIKRVFDTKPVLN